MDVPGPVTESYATALATPNPFTLEPGQGLNLCLCRDMSCCSWILNPRHHSGNSSNLLYLQFFQRHLPIYIPSTSVGEPQLLLVPTNLGFSAF